MIVVDWGKLGTLITAITSVTVLAALKVVPGEMAVGVISLALGYTVGNGRQAAKGLPPQPLIGRAPVDDVEA